MGKAKIEMLRDRRGKYQGLSKELRASGESQISLTDPDSRAMLNNQRVEVCYNVQATVDDKAVNESGILITQRIG